MTSASCFKNSNFSDNNETAILLLAVSIFTLSMQNLFLFSFQQIIGASFYHVALNCMLLQEHFKISHKIYSTIGLKFLFRPNFVNPQ